MSDVLTTLGENNVITQSEADPVHCCLEGSYLNCPENPMRFDKDMCTNFMAQRCARNWDSYCDLYITELDNKSVVGKYSGDFLNKAAESKFCRDDTSNPNAHCVTRCELVNPSANGGAIVCKEVGELIYRDKNQFYNISTDFTNTKGLDTTAPLKTASCPKVCDVLNLSSLDDTDRVLNECLQRGTCQTVMMDLAQRVKKNNVNVTNKRLLEFINQYIVSNPSQQLSQAAQLGGQGPTLTAGNQTIPGPSNEIVQPVQQITTRENYDNIPSIDFAQNVKTPPQQRVNNVHREKFNGGKKGFFKQSLPWIVLIVIFVLFILKAKGSI